MRWYTLYFVIFLSAATLVYSNVPLANAAPPWQYESPIEILNSGNALADYQIQVALSTNTFDYSKANQDGSDLRFTDDTKTVFYDYWIETWNPSGESKIWVKVPSIPSGSSIMYMWHGNLGAVSQSNGSTTFDFFDDFDDGDISDWNTFCENEDVAGESCTYSADNTTYISASYSLSLYGWGSCGGPTFNGLKPTVSRTLTLDDGSYKLEFFEKGWGGQWGFCSNGWAGETSAYSDATNIYSSSACSYIGCSRCSTSWGNAISDIFNVNGGATTIKLSVLVTDCEEGRGWFDNIRVRKYVSPEPTAVLPYSLTVNTAGMGSGTVTSDPTGIDCGADCFEAYLQDTNITLTATPDPGSAFDGFTGGGCLGNGECTFLLDQDSTITATFNPDGDSDGISDLKEDGGPNGGDGNADGTLDSLQANVATFQSIIGSYVTLISETGTVLANVIGTVNPSCADSPQNCTYPQGFFGFTVKGITPGAATTVQVILHEKDTSITTYYKYGPTPDNHADQWYSFFSGGQTGATINHGTTQTSILLSFIDGQMGDDDLSANGEITDVGGPANQSGGGSGDCFISTMGCGTLLGF